MRVLALLLPGVLFTSAMAEPADTFPACTNERDAGVLSIPRVSQSRSVEEPAYRASPGENSVLKGKAARQAAQRPRVQPVIAPEVLEKQRVYLERAKVVAANHDGSKEDLDRKLRTLKLELFARSGLREERGVH